MQPQDERQKQANDFGVREEATIPEHIPKAASLNAGARRASAELALITLGAILVSSGIIEYGGWQIAFQESAQLRADGIHVGQFLRGLFDTASGALGIGLIAAASTLLFPSTWKLPWRRLAVAFAGGAAAFLAFLALLTLPASL
jgi:hypothetical protein